MKPRTGLVTSSGPSHIGKPALTQRTRDSQISVDLLARRSAYFGRNQAEAGGESRGAYFLYASTLDAGIAKGSSERHRPSPSRAIARQDARKSSSVDA